ncbi:MAG: hypothetical protein AAGG44_18960 [Planctomycetota bacterium]
MHETTDDLLALQNLLDTSVAGAGSHLKSMFSGPLTASEVVEELGGIFEVHFATVTPSGAPFVAPIDSLFYRGQLWVGIPATAVRSSFVRKDHRVSISYTRGETFCLIVHGHAVEVGRDDALFEQYSAYSDSEYIKLYGEKWLDWVHDQQATFGWGDLWRIHAAKMFVKK